MEAWTWSRPWNSLARTAMLPTVMLPTVIFGRLSPRSTW